MPPISSTPRRRGSDARTQDGHYPAVLLRGAVAALSHAGRPECGGRGQLGGLRRRHAVPGERGRVTLHLKSTAKAAKFEYTDGSMDVSWTVDASLEDDELVERLRRIVAFYDAP